jgi:hypothetical protein
MAPMVSFFWGFPVGKNDIATVSYRFDALPTQKPKVDFPSTETFVLDTTGSQAFLHQVGRSSSLTVETTSVVGQATAEFDTSGADAPLAELAGCVRSSPSHGHTRPVGHPY